MTPFLIDNAVIPASKEPLAPNKCPVIDLVELIGILYASSLNTDFISSRQIEAARRAFTRYIKRSGKVWIRIFPDKVVTKLPAETRMGKGKGMPEYWVAPVKVGTMLFEISGVDIEKAKRAFYLASSKLPVKTKFLIKG